MSSSWLQNLTNFRLSGVSTRSSNYTNKDKILVVKCTFDKVRMRRITFASVKQVKWSLFKAKVQQAFSLSPSFRIVYVDDDGDITDINSDADLEEAITYFSSGSGPDDDEGRITMRVDVLVEYEGPSLSDSGSIRTNSIYGMQSNHSSDSSGSYKYGVKNADACSISLSQSSSEKSSKKSKSSFSLRSLRLSKQSSSVSYDKYREQGLRLADKTKSHFKSPNTTSSDRSIRSSVNEPTYITNGKQWDDPLDDNLSDTETHRQQPLISPSKTYTPSEASSERTHNPLKVTESTPSLNAPEDVDVESQSEEVGLLQQLHLAPGPGRGELAARWFADQSERALLATFGTQLAPSEATSSSHESESELDADADSHADSVSLELEQDGHGSYRYTITGSSEDENHVTYNIEDAPSLLSHNFSTFSTLNPQCASCSSTLENLRYICTTCGPFDRNSGCEFCTECVEGAGAVHALESASSNSHKHCFRECVRVDSGWTSVDYGYDRTCSICNSVLGVDFKCVSCNNLNLCTRCYGRVSDIHPSHAFLSLPHEEHQATPATSSQSLPTQSSAQNKKHQNVFCHNCLGDIVGPRFHCAVCALYDLCQDCEKLGAANDNGHDSTHIMMKIPVPLSNDEVQQASARARGLWNTDQNPTNSLSYSQLRPRAVKLDHKVHCRGCSNRIFGTRFACVHCPHESESYDLCVDCEPMSYIMHDPMHIFLKLEKPLAGIGLKNLSNQNIHLPLLYEIPAGNRGSVLPTHQIAPSALGGPNEYLGTIKHPNVVCDRCMEAVCGVWYRCVNLHGSYDLCANCEPSDPHRGEHIYLVLKSNVNMSLFGQVAEIGSENGKALLPGLTYKN